MLYSSSTPPEIFFTYSMMWFRHTTSEFLCSVSYGKMCFFLCFFFLRENFKGLLTGFVYLPKHRDNLLKFPHLAAIQHNNCMFLAHHLLTLGHQFRPHLPLKDGVAYFVDLVPGFRKLGKSCRFLLPFKTWTIASSTLMVFLTSQDQGFRNLFMCFFSH